MQRESQFSPRKNCFFPYNSPLNIMNYMQQPFQYAKISPNNQCFENRNSHIATYNKRIPQELNDNDQDSNSNSFRKERYSFPVVNVSNEVLKDAFFLPKKINSIKKSAIYNSQLSDQDTTNTTLNQTEESSARNSINNLCEEAIAYNSNQYITPEIKRINSNNSNHCISPMISNFSLYDNQQNQQQNMLSFSTRFSQNINNTQEGVGKALNYNNMSMQYFNHEKDNKNAATIKSPFNKFTSPEHKGIMYNINQSCCSPQNNYSFGITHHHDENTEILSVNVKISSNDNAIFILKRYDDLFNTIKFFCEINKIDEKLIKPMILRTLEALNQIYQAMNYPLNDDDKICLEYIRMQQPNNDNN